MGSEYEFSQLGKSNKSFKLELPNCKITGNSSQFVLKDNSIMVYNLDQNGNVVENSGEAKDTVNLTKYQLSVFELLKARDGNEKDFGKDDLKGLSEEELKNLINEKFASGGVYTVKEVKLKRNSLHVQLLENNNKVRNLKIEFEKVGFFKRIRNFFKNLFTSNESDKLKGKIEVGEIEVESILEPVKEGVKDNNQDASCEMIEDRFNNKENHISQSFKSEIQESFEYTIKKGDRIIVLANELGIPLFCIRQANKGVNLDTVGVGQKITIPSRKLVENFAISNSQDIAKYTGYSESFIEYIQNVEGFRSKPYPDGERYSVGYGHNGRILGKYVNNCANKDKYIVMTKENINKIALTESDACKILAQDIIDRTAEAEAFLGESFTQAPKSLQSGIVDIIFNAGVENGLNDTKTRNLKMYLENRNYVEAVKSMIVYGNNSLLYKRNAERVLLAIEDLPNSEKKKILESKSITEHFDKTINHLKKIAPMEAERIKKSYQASKLLQD